MNQIAFQQFMQYLWRIIYENQEIPKHFIFYARLDVIFWQMILRKPLLPQDHG